MMRYGSTASALVVLTLCTAPAAAQHLLQPLDQASPYPPTDSYGGPLAWTGACNSSNNTAVGSCFDWVTGPASPDNATVPVKYRDPATGAWTSAPMWETDQGWPVMSPDGQALELMAYGDTYARNPSFGVADLAAQVQLCAAFSPGDPGGLMTALGVSKSAACEYVLAWQHHAGSQGLVIPVFTATNNVVLFDAEIDPSRTYRIGLVDHLRHKAVLHNGFEPSGDPDPTGVYTTDYLYVCPGAATDCADSQKLLYFVTGTVYWKDTSTEAQRRFKLEREGAGLYRFGPLSEKATAAPGCRVRFSPDALRPPPGAPPDPSCPNQVKTALQPWHAHEHAPGKTVGRTLNPHVLWGWGSKFGVPVVMHGFTDTLSAGPSSANYIYFLGSGELDTKVGLLPTPHYTPTWKVFLARVLASQAALEGAGFQYYAGTVAGKPQWGSYATAVSLMAGAASSFTKRFGRYFVAAGVGGGMGVAESLDGFFWGKLQYAAYTDLVAQPAVVGSPSPAWLIYGHAWVPEALYPHPDAIAYVFSLWKSPRGYFDDFWFAKGPKSPVPLGESFPYYNTKMYLFWPKP
jgi:hypothetical protein